MFQNINLLYIFGPAIALASTVLAVLKKRQQKKDISEISTAIEHFKMTAIVFGALLVMLWLLLPQTAVLQSFGYPDDVSSVSTNEKTLHLFQAYNRALVRTTQVLYWFLFLFIWWFLTTLFGVVSAFKAAEDKSFVQPATL